jgi:TRAP-type C4-dicarboxylate transport system substrate-binding protein
VSKYFPFVLLAALILVGMPGTVPNTRAEETVTLRIASLAPAGSSWMKVLNAWKTTLEDERDFVRKMRVGQLDGGVVTMSGMSLLVRPMVILVLPDFLDTYEELDRVRLKMSKDFEKMFEDEGFMMVAWGDAGKTRLFSKKKIERPSDIKSMRPWMWKDDLIFIEFYDVIGASAVRLGVPEVYPGLQTNMIDVVTSSALTAVALQWYTRRGVLADV